MATSKTRRIKARAKSSYRRWLSNDPHILTVKLRLLPSRQRRVIGYLAAYTAVAVVLIAGLPYVIGAVIAVPLLLKVSTRTQAKPFLSTLRTAGGSYNARELRTFGFGLTVTEDDDALWCDPGRPTGRYRSLGRLSSYGALLAAIAVAAVPQPGGIIAHLLSGLAAFYIAQCATATARGMSPARRATMFHPPLLDVFAPLSKSEARTKDKGTETKDDAEKADATTDQAATSTPSPKLVVRAQTALLAAAAVVVAVLVLVIATAPAVTVGAVGAALGVALWLGAATFLVAFGRPLATVDQLWPKKMEANHVMWTKIWAPPLWPATIKAPKLLSVNMRPTTDQALYTIATFELPQGIDYKTVEALETKLAESLLTTSTVIVSPARTLNDDGQPTGPAIGGQFSVTYLPAGSVPNHLERRFQTEARLIKDDVRALNRGLGEVDFVVMTSAVRRAFTAAKLSVPTVVDINHLYLPLASRPNASLFAEVKVTLDDGTTYADIVKAQPRLAAALHAPYLRVGQRVDDLGQGQYHTHDAISIIIGCTDPANLRLSTDTKNFIASLDWAEHWRAAKVINAAGATPRLTELSTHGIGQQATFMLPAGIASTEAVIAQPRLAGILGTDLIIVRSDTTNTVTVTWMPPTRAASFDDDLAPSHASKLAPEDVAALADPLWTTPNDEDTRSHIVEATLLRAWAAAKLPAPRMVDLNDMADISLEGHASLVETVWTLPAGTTFEDVLKTTKKLEAAVGAPFVRIGRRPESELVSLVYAENPATLDLDEDTTFLLDALRWDSIFQSCKLTDTEGLTPAMQSSAPAEGDLTVWTFAPAAGLSVDEVKIATAKLKASMRCGYIEVQEGEAGGFNIVEGTSDPLDRGYLFRDYEPQVLLGPGPVPNLEWAIGVGVDGKLITYDYNGGDIPHALLGGATGGGKTTVAFSMMLQLMFNNTPGTQLEMWLCDPKNTEMAGWKDIAHVTRYIDGDTGENAFDGFIEEILEPAVAEMDRRNSLFKSMPSNPKNLMEARPHLPADDPCPFIVIVVDECADYFAQPSTKKDNGSWERVKELAAKIGRKARSSGIAICWATQYPTDRSIASDVRVNTRGIALLCSTQMQSMVILGGHPGAEKINTRGRGLMMVDKDLKGFRSMYFRAPSESKPDEPNDLADLIDLLPKSAGPKLSSNGGGLTEVVPGAIPDDIWD